MSTTTQGWVWQHSRTSGNDRLILLALADEANDFGGSCYPGARLLASKCVIGIATVGRCLDRLELVSEILIHRPDKQGRGHHNRYFVLMGRDPSTFVFVGTDWEVRPDEGTQSDDLPIGSLPVDNSVRFVDKRSERSSQGDQSDDLYGDKRSERSSPRRNIPKTQLHDPLPVGSDFAELWKYMAKQHYDKQPAGSVRSSANWIKAKALELQTEHQERVAQFVVDYPQFGLVQLSDVLEGRGASLLRSVRRAEAS